MKYGKICTVKFCSLLLVIGLFLLPDGIVRPKAFYTLGDVYVWNGEYFKPKSFSTFNNTWVLVNDDTIRTLDYRKRCERTGDIVECYDGNHYTVKYSEIDKTYDYHDAHWIRNGNVWKKQGTVNVREQWVVEGHVPEIFMIVVLYNL